MGTEFWAHRALVIQLSVVKEICPREFARLEAILQEQGNTFVELANADRDGHHCETELAHPGVGGKRYDKKVARLLRNLERAFENATAVKGKGIVIHLVDAHGEEYLEGEYDTVLIEPHFEAREESVALWTPAVRKLNRLFERKHPHESGLLDCMFVERG